MGHVGDMPGTGQDSPPRVGKNAGQPVDDQREDRGTGLQERSRAPHHCPHHIDPGTAAAIVEARRQHPSWGPRADRIVRESPLTRQPIVSMTSQALFADRARSAATGEQREPVLRCSVKFDAHLIL